MSSALRQRLKHLFFSFLGLLIRTQTPSDLTTHRFRRILVIRQHDQLGDMLCAVPLLRSLRKRYPLARIALMTSPVNHAVMLHNPYVDRIILYDKREFLSRFFLKPVRLLGFIREIRRERFELVLVPATVSVSVTSDLIAWLSGAPYRIGAGRMNGTRDASAVFFNCPVRLEWRADPHRHQTLRNLDIAQELSLDTSDRSSEIKVTGRERERAKEFLAVSEMTGSFIVFHPGAGKPPNRWPAERFAEVANTLAREGTSGIVVTHGPMDDEPVRLMQAGLRSAHLVVEKKNIREVAAVLSLGRLVISNDTGIMHVAAAVGTPVLSLFGPTDPEQWAPIGTGNRFIRGKGGDIRSITVMEVLTAARAMITDPRSS